ncbi:hypothetical protein, partial [Blastopirellula marina]|uniref:hypothetical protein n=1 Tax=Blastopirellula marina TaxID=124 RepID=UPI001E44BAC4
PSHPTSPLHPSHHLTSGKKSFPRIQQMIEQIGLDENEKFTGSVRTDAQGLPGQQASLPSVFSVPSVAKTSLGRGSRVAKSVRGLGPHSGPYGLLSSSLFAV